MAAATTNDDIKSTIIVRDEVYDRIASNPLFARFKDRLFKQTAPETKLRQEKLLSRAHVVSSEANLCGFVTTTDDLKADDSRSQSRKRKRGILDEEGQRALDTWLIPTKVVHKKLSTTITANEVTDGCTSSISDEGSRRCGELVIDHAAQTCAVHTKSLAIKPKWWSQIENWWKELNEGSKRMKRVLILCGPSGSGKSLAIYKNLASRRRIIHLDSSQPDNRTVVQQLLTWRTRIAKGSACFVHLDNVHPNEQVSAKDWRDLEMLYLRSNSMRHMPLIVETTPSELDQCKTSPINRWRKSLFRISQRLRR